MTFLGSILALLTFGWIVEGIASVIALIFICGLVSDNKPKFSLIPITVFLIFSWTWLGWYGYFSMWSALAWMGTHKLQIFYGTIGFIVFGLFWAAKELRGLIKANRKSLIPIRTRFLERSGLGRGLPERVIDGTDELPVELKPAWTLYVYGDANLPRPAWTYRSDVHVPNGLRSVPPVNGEVFATTEREALTLVNERHPGLDQRTLQIVGPVLTEIRPFLEKLGLYALTNDTPKWNPYEGEHEAARLARLPRWSEVDKSVAAWFFFWWAYAINYVLSSFLEEVVEKFLSTFRGMFEGVMKRAHRYIQRDFVSPPDYVNSEIPSDEV